MKLKVCGIKQLEQVKQLDSLGIDFIGFIHYKKSPRNVSLAELLQLNKTTKATKVLVTVNESVENLYKLSDALKTKTVQLHGNESPKICKELKENNFTIIKAFGISEAFDFKTLNEYKNCVDYFLFDYKGEQPGGNGSTFNWELLQNYTLDIPYFLSGGIGIHHKEPLKNLSLKHCFAIDVNSKFEKEPGIKDITLLTKFIK